MENSSGYKGLDKIVDYGLSYIRRTQPKTKEDSINKMRPIFVNLLTHHIINYDISKIATDYKMYKASIDMILTIRDEVYNHIEKNFKSKSTRSIEPRHWTMEEDVRLLAAILKYDDIDWNIIAKYVGCGRNKAQCAQRWYRTLNPRIRKDEWSLDEERELLKLINESKGSISWTKILNKLGTRTDVQCRYHYDQMREKRQIGGMSFQNIHQSVECVKIPPIHEEFFPEQRILPLNVCEFLKSFTN